MVKILLNSKCNMSMGYGAGEGDTETYEYMCPCGKGKIIEEHDNIPGFREHDVYIYCDECRDKYDIDTSKGVRNWELVKRTYGGTD